MAHDETVTIEKACGPEGDGVVIVGTKFLEEYGTGFYNKS